MHRTFSTLFLVALVAYFAFAAIEEFVPGFVSDYFNPHLLLIPVVGFLVVLLTHERSEAPPLSTPTTPKIFGKKGAGLILLASLVTLAVLWIGARELPTFWRVLVALYGGLLVAGILTVLFKE